MKLLLDTSALLALAGQAGKLPSLASRALASPEQVSASAVTAWEIAIKAKTGKLHMSISPHAWFLQTLERYQLEEIAADTRLLCAAADLPLIHRDLLTGSSSPPAARGTSPSFRLTGSFPPIPASNRLGETISPSRPRATHFCLSVPRHPLRLHTTPHPFQQRFRNDAVANRCLASGMVVFDR